MDLNYVKHVRQNEVEDIFSYINCEGEVEYLKYPRSEGMTVQRVREWLED